MLKFTLSLLLLVHLKLSLASVAEEQCHTFAGGSVYPNTEGRASGHSLQWTKAMSKL